MQTEADLQKGSVMRDHQKHIWNNEEMPSLEPLENSFKTWCGAPLEQIIAEMEQAGMHMRYNVFNDRSFDSIDEAARNGRDGGRFTVCPDCLRAICKALSQEVEITINEKED